MVNRWVCWSTWSWSDIGDGLERRLWVCYGVDGSLVDGDITASASEACTLGSCGMTLEELCTLGTSEVNG